MFRINKKYSKLFSKRFTGDSSMLTKFNTTILFGILGVLIFQNVSKTSYFTNKTYGNFPRDIIDNIKFSELKFNKDGTFKIAILGDLHLKKDNFEYDLNKTIVDNKPDLVILNGNIMDNSNTLSSVDRLNKIMTNNSIPFIYNFGKSENKLYLKEKVYDYLSRHSLNYRQYYYGGLTNQLVKLSLNNKYFYFVVLLDSNGNNMNINQLNYLDKVCKINNNINGMLFVHKQIHEINNNEGVLNDGLLNVLKGCNNVNIVFNGDSQGNNKCKYLHGKKMCFSSSKIQYFTLDNYGRSEIF
jgi:hypothetical protein